MIGVFIQTGTGTVERKEKPGSWELAPFFTKEGKYLLYSVTLFEINPNFFVAIERHTSILNGFRISKCGDDLEVVINGQRVFSIDNEGGTSELQEGVALKKNFPDRAQEGVTLKKNSPDRVIVIYEDADDVEIQILRKVNRKEYAVARARLVRVGEEREKEVLANEIR